MKFPILEFDPARRALINPKVSVQGGTAPARCVICFFQEVLSRLRRRGKARVIATLNSEIGPNPVYEFRLRKKRLAAFHPGVGASLAALSLEEAIALGCRKFVACGAAGVLDGSVGVGHVVVPTEAVRDEGTSYHYLPPKRTVRANPRAVSAICRVLKSHGIKYLLAKTWTTDGPYRETRAKIRRRLAEGCLTVEMEAAAFLAVARFRRVEFGQLLYAGDDVSGSTWDDRGTWGVTRLPARERLFRLAAEACSLL